MSPQPLPHAAAASIEKHLKSNNKKHGGTKIPYTWQWRAAAAAATHLNIYGSNLEIIIPYIVMYVAAAAAACRCRVY